MSAYKSLASKIFARLWRHRVALAALFCGVLAPMVVLEDVIDAARGARPLLWDVQVLQALHGAASPGLDAAVVWGTRAGYWLILPFVLGVLWFLRSLQRPAEAVFFAATVGGAWLLNICAKQFFGRVRPALWESALPERTYSFPSGHSMLSMALALALVVLLWPTRWRILALFGAPPAVFLVGLSRLYLGVHYPTDVLGGWCAGLIWATGTYFVCRPNRAG